MAKDEELVSRIDEQVGVESEAVEPACPRKGSEAAFQHALELSKKDGSIVLSAGSMFVTAEVMTAWDKINSRSKAPTGKVNEQS